MRKGFMYDRAAARIEENGKTVTMWSLLLPLLLESIFLLMYGTANTLLLSGYSAKAVSAVSVSTQILNVAVVMLNMIIKGTVTITSVALGSQNRERAGRVAGTGSVLTAALGLVFGVILCVFSDIFTSYMNLSGEVQGLAIQYLTVYALFLPVTSLQSYVNNLLIANGYTKCTMVVGVTGNLINIALSYIVLYTGIELPVSGVTAVAVSGVVAQLVGLLLALWFFFRNRCPFRLFIDRKTVFDICRIGVPAGMALFSFTMSQTITTGFVAALGTVAINTKVYITNIVSYTSRISYSIGNANAILMGRHRGAENYDSITTLFRQNLSITMMCNSLLSMVTFFLRRPLLSLFTDDSSILEAAALILFIDIFLEIGRGINHITENSLNANGDVKATLLISVISCWLFSVLLAYLLCSRAGLGLTGIWLGFAADELFRGSACLIRWWRGNWKTSKI